MKTYHQRIITLGYFAEDLPKFETTEEQQAFYAALGRQVMYGMQRDEQTPATIQLVNVSIDNRGPLEIDAAFYPPMLAREEQGHYLGSVDHKVDDFLATMKARIAGHPFVIGAVSHNDGTFSFHS